MKEFKKYIIGFIIGLLLVGTLTYAADNGSIGSLFTISGGNWVLMGDNIEDGTVDSSEIENNSLTASDLATNSVGTIEIVNDTITEIDISNTFKSRDSNLLDNIDSASFLRSDVDDTFLGVLSVGSTLLRQTGIYGIYDSTKIGHIWSIGKNYKILADGSTFGNLYGLAYKHTNNVTGGTMAGGHQMVWVQNGVGKSAMGTNIWTSGQIIVDSAVIVGNDGYVEGDRIRDGSVDSTEIQDNTLTAADLAPNSVGDSELIANPAFTNPTASTPTASNHVATKAYVDSVAGGSSSISFTTVSMSSNTTYSSLSCSSGTKFGVFIDLKCHCHNLGTRYINAGIPLGYLETPNTYTSKCNAFCGGSGGYTIGANGTVLCK